MKTFLGYTRDSQGKVVNHHIQPLSNTITSFFTDNLVLIIRKL